MLNAIALAVSVFLLLVNTALPSSPGFDGFGSTATLSLAFHIGSSKSDDSSDTADNYATAEGDSVVLALVSSGTAFGTNYNSAYSASDYLIQMTQGSKDNRFILAFTQGGNQTIKSKLGALGNKKIPGERFGSLAFAVPKSFRAFLRLEFETADIISRAFWSGSQEIIIRNEGGNENGIPKISIEVV